MIKLGFSYEVLREREANCCVVCPLLAIISLGLYWGVSLAVVAL